MTEPLSAAQMKKSCASRNATKALAVKIPTDLHEEFHALARQNGSTGAAVIREMVEAYCEDLS